MRLDNVGSVAATGSKPLTSVMAVIIALLIIGFFIADHLFPVTASAAASQLIHNSANTGSTRYTWGADYTCATCHSKQAKKNIKFVNYSIVTPDGKKRPVIFNRYTTSSNDVTGVFGNDERTMYKDGSRNVCEVCHHLTIYHNYSATKLNGQITHAEHGPKGGGSNRKDCNGCHKHSTGYKAPKVGECTSCHGIPPISKETMVEGSYTLGNPPPNAGAHDRHRNVEGMECYTCHNNYGHFILGGNDMIEMGFRIDKRTWKGFSGISTVMSGTYTGTIGAPFTNNFAVAPGNPGTTLLRQAGVNSCSIYCHGDGWAVDSGKAPAYAGQISWTNGPLGGPQRDCSASACHGTTAANPPNPGRAGAHTRHVKDLNQACTKCHEEYTNPHMINGRVAWNLSGQGANAKYNGHQRYSTATLPGVAAYGSCTDIYCHSSVQADGGNGDPLASGYKSIQWGSSTALGCDGCHGGKSTDTTHIASGAHTKHMDTYAYACSACHNGYGADGALMNHLNNNIEVVFNSYSGSYDQMPVNRPGDGYGNCSANYCHSDGKGNKKSVSWGAKGTIGCNSCHKTDQAGNAVNTGKHTAHVDNTNPLFSAAPYGCVTCHANTVTDNSHIAADNSRHVNKLGDYSGARAGRYTRATGACDQSYCHSDGKGRAPAVAVNWKDGSTITNCKGCHGNSPGGTFVGAAGEPNYPNMYPTDPTFANSHDRHMGGVGLSTCVFCHDDTVTDSGLKVNSLHLNGSKNVKAGGGKQFQYPAAKTCRNISCHGAGSNQVEWGQKLPADCTGCHNGNAATVPFKPMSSGKHLAHISPTSNVGHLGKGFRCATCHARTAGLDDRSIVDTAVHGNGFKNFTGPLAGSSKSYSTAKGVCKNSYCHSDGKGQFQLMTSTIGWKSPRSVKFDCKTCHGNSAAADFISSPGGEPNYANTTPGGFFANDHKNHVDNAQFTCVACHADTVDASGLIFTNSSSHLNGRVDVKAGPGKSFIYGAGKTCSTISCHGGKGVTVQTWGTTPSSDCTGCHGNNAGNSGGSPASSLPIATDRHSSHMNNAATLGMNYNCTECHAQTINIDERSFANRGLHGNGLINYSGAKAGKAYDELTGNCANTYCHTDGKGGRNVTFGPTTGWTSGTVYVNCIGCHGNSPGGFVSAAGEPNYANTGAPGSITSNSHQLHVGTAGAGACYSCHADVVGVTGITVNTKHINRFITYSTSNVAGKTFRRGAGKTCSNIACHGAGAPQATWGADLGCSSCHGGNAGTAPSDINTGKHRDHIKNADLGDNLGCAECHAQVVNSDTTFANRALHANGFPNFSGAKSGKNKTACNVAYCHSNGKGVAGIAIDWNTSSDPAFTKCVGCHGTATGTGSFVSQAGEPNYENTGAVGSATSNSHKSHTTNLPVLKGAATCVICHVETVTTAGTQIKPGSRHLDRSIDVKLDPGQAGIGAIYNPDRTCSNTSCHGSPAPKWGDASSAGCKSCHANLLSSGAHAAHIGSDVWTAGYATMYNYTSNNSSGVMYRYGCANCHPVTETGNHHNGTYGDIDLSSTATGAGALRKLNKQILSAGVGYTKNGTTSFTCDLVYCHSDGRDTTSPVFKKSPNWYGGSFVGNKCAMCHENPPQYDNQSHYVAKSSLGNNGTPPYKETGHMIGIHFKNNAKGNNQNGFLGFSSSGSMAHGNPDVATTISCYICHNGIVSSVRSEVDTFAMYTTPTSSFRCANCHTANTRTKLQPGKITDTALHVNGFKNVLFAPISDFRTKAQLKANANAPDWNRYDGYKTDVGFDSADLSGMPPYDLQEKTCMTACHVKQSIKWGGKPKCVSCHVNQ